MYKFSFFHWDNCMAWIVEMDVEERRNEKEEERILNRGKFHFRILNLLFDTKKYLLFTKSCFWEFHQGYEWKKCTFFGNFWLINVSKIEWSHRLVNDNSATYLKSCQTSIASLLLKCYQTYDAISFSFFIFIYHIIYN